MNNANSHCHRLRTVALLVLGLTSFTGQLIAEDTFTNLAASSSLPQGSGLAARFTNDVGIATHQAVIFADDFESGELGAHWEEKTAGHVLGLAAPGGGVCGRRCLKVEAHLGENSGGGLTKWFESTPEVFVRF